MRKLFSEQIKRLVIVGKDPVPQVDGCHDKIALFEIRFATLPPYSPTTAAWLRILKE